MSTYLLLVLLALLFLVLAILNHVPLWICILLIIVALLIGTWLDRRDNQGQS